MKVIFRMAFVEGEVIKQKLRVSMQVLCSRTELALNVVKVVSPENQEMTGVLFRVHDVPDDWPWYEIELYGYMERTIQDLFVTPDKLLRAGQAEDRYTYTVKSMLGARESQLQKRGLLNCAEFAAMAKEATAIQKELEAQQAQDDIRRGSLSEGHSVKLEQQTASTLNDECGAAMPPPQARKHAAHRAGQQLGAAARVPSAEAARTPSPPLLGVLSPCDRSGKGLLLVTMDSLRQRACWLLMARIASLVRRRWRIPSSASSHAPRS